MSGLKKNWVFRRWKAIASQSTLKSSTSQPCTALTASNLEGSSNGIVISTIPVREDSHENHEALSVPGQHDIWGLAYKQLLAENEPLVRHYEEVLKAAAINSDDSAADIQEQIQLVLVVKRNQVLQKQWRLQWGNKSVKVRTQIDRIVKIISVFKDAGSVVANVDPLHAGLPWAGICFLLAPILNDSQQCEALLSGLEMITDLVARHRIVEEHLSQGSPPNGSHLDTEVEYRKIVTKLYTKVLEFQAKAACYLSNGTLTRFARNIPKVDDWRMLQSNIARIETECREYTSLTFALKQQSSLRILAESLEEQEERLADRIANQSIQQDAAQMVSRLISDVSVGQDHEDIRTRLGSRYWDSGQWLFKTQQYFDWTNCVCSSILWLQGPVGVGKSCMTSVVIQHFLASANDDKVAFFYCSQQHSSSADVLRSLLAQMSYGTDGDLLQPIREWFELQTGLPFKTHKRLYTTVPPHLARKISSKECVELFGEILPHTTQTTFIIDALDECHDHSELLDHLKGMQEQFSNLKIFVSSRMGIYPKYKFSHRSLIEHFDSSSDMIHFIDCEIHSPARRDQSGMTPTQAELLRDLLISKAYRMFRWVELQLDVFLNRNNPILHPADVQTKLDQLQFQSTHPSLTSVYRDLFSLNTQDQAYRRELAIKSLQWVFCAFKPLTLEDLAQAVALGSDGTIDTVVTSSFLLQVCGNFIIVTNSGSVRFAHRSVKEFLTRILLPGSRSFDFTISNAHAQVAETCLSFLVSFEDASKWASLPTNPHEEAVGLSLTGFEMYACFFWAAHCEKAMTDGSAVKLALEFVHLFDKFVFLKRDTLRRGQVMIAGPAFQKWTSLLWRVFRTDSNLGDPIRHRLEDSISDPPLPLFAACIWGFTDGVRLMLRRGQLVNARNCRGKSCLYLACENGHGELVSTIMRHSIATVDEEHERWGSALQAAASSGLLTSFVMLLGLGARMNTPEGFYGRTLDAAIHGGNPAIVTHALKAGAEVWLPSSEAPFRLSRRRSRSPCSTATASSGTLSDVSLVFDRLIRDPATRAGKYDRPTGQNDLIERLGKACLRRRELLDYWRLASKRAPVARKSSDKRVIVKEIYRPRIVIAGKRHPVRYPAPTRDGPAFNVRCDYCFRDLYYSQPLDSPDVLSSWRHHITDDIFPYLCPFPGCGLKQRMWGNRLDWEDHLNDQHPITSVVGDDPQRFFFTCQICAQSFIDDHDGGDEFRNSCTFRNSHYADHMERIALSVGADYGPDSSALSGKRTPELHSKRRRRHRYRSGLAGLASGHDSSSSGRDEEAISGWSSEGSTGSRG